MKTLREIIQSLREEGGPLSAAQAGGPACRQGRGLRVFQAGSLGGRPLTAAEQASAVQAGQQEQVFQAMVQALEGAAAWWQSVAQHEDVVAKGMGPYFTGGAAALADVLTDIKAWTEGQGPREKERRVKS